MVLLEVKGLTYSVRDKKPLSGLDLTVHEQEIHALLGANGAGKTTLANLIMGCGGYIPTAGEIRFQGQLINTLAIHERARLGITLAWQEPARFEGLSVGDYLSLGRAANAPADCLRRVGLEPGLYLGRALDKALSGGERKRIELASLLALKPKLAILDEPDSGIDMLSLQEVVDVIKELQREGAAVLLITHRQEIARIANRASLLCGGRLVMTVENPIHTCVGLMKPHGSQHIRLLVKLEAHASAHIVAHCLFPNAEKVRHVMESRVELGEGAELHHSEGHYHGPWGGIEVVPQADVRVGPHARYFSDFSLTSGRVGKLHIDYRVVVEKQGVAEITARVYGHGTDEIRIRDELVLEGEDARGLIKSRVAVEDEATSAVIGVTHGKAAGARGHMDCKEIVRDHAVASAEPIVRVEHPQAMVTHEAAVGTVDQKQLETLMAHGLTPDEAVDVVISGLLR